VAEARPRTRAQAQKAEFVEIKVEKKANIFFLDENSAHFVENFVGNRDPSLGQTTELLCCVAKLLRFIALETVKYAVQYLLYQCGLGTQKMT
jgi:hypothetical protein